MFFPEAAFEKGEKNEMEKEKRTEKEREGKSGERERRGTFQGHSRLNGIYYQH